MVDRSLLVVVLAAGEGKRMRSGRPKVMHAVAHLPMIGHVVSAAASSGAAAVEVIVGPGHDETNAFLGRHAPAATTRIQTDRRGTAHATLVARETIAQGFDDVVVAFGDTPLLSSDTIARLRAPLADGATIAVAAMRPADPTGYGRLILDGDRLVAIREHKDASEGERAIGLCNGGLMAFAGSEMLALLDAIGSDNAQGEFYLTDAVAVAAGKGGDVRHVEVGVDEVAGVNSRLDLAGVEALFQTRRRRRAIEEGAQLLAPDTVHFAFDTVLGVDAVVEPYVVFAPGCRVGEGAVVHAFSHLEGAEVGAGASVGPYARLRPGAVIGAKARVGNFVEVKNARLGEGAKANHLAYLGDAEIGAGSNIGAGTITCNYDGVHKARTVIGRQAFIGSNTSLVAPVTIGDGAYVASGSVVTADVEADALAFGRARQVNKPGRAAALRQRKP